MIKIVHTGDLRLEPSLLYMSEGMAAARRQDYMETLVNLLEAARKTGPDALLISGNLFDTWEPAPGRLLDVIDMLKAFTETTKAHVFCVSGQRDTPMGRDQSEGVIQALARSGMIHTFSGNSRFGSISVAGARGEVFTVYGKNYSSPPSNLTPLLPIHDPFSGIGIIMASAVLRLQGGLTVKNGAPSSSILPAIDLSSIEKSGICYAALGGIEETALGNDNGFAWAYPGPMERISLTGNSGSGAILAVEMEISGKGAGEVRIETMKLPLRRLSEVVVDLDPGTASVEERVLKAIDAEKPDRDSILLVRVTGRVYYDVFRAFDRESLNRRLADRFHSAAVVTELAVEKHDPTGFFEFDPPGVREAFTRTMLAREAAEGPRCTRDRAGLLDLSRRIGLEIIERAGE